MTKVWIIWAIGLAGFAGLVVALFFTKSSEPDSSPGWDITIATMSGILLGGGLGAWADGLCRRQGRLPLAVAGLAFGVLYVAVTSPIFVESLRIEDLAVVYPAVGGAIGGAGLSLLLTHYARRTGDTNLRGGSHRYREENVDQSSGRCRRNAPSAGCSWILRLSRATLTWWSGPRRKTPSAGDNIYQGSLVHDSIGALIVEMRWEQLAAFIKAQGASQGLEYSPIIVALDTAQVDGSTGDLPVNPTLRVTKGRKAMIVRATSATIPNSEHHMLLLRTLTLAHLERHFKFNLVTWRFANTIPVWIAGAAFAVWGQADGWQLHKSDDFFAAIAGIIGLTALAFTLWRLVVQESEKQFDTLCRRLESELLASNMDTLSRIMRNLVAAMGAPTEQWPRGGPTPPTQRSQ